MDKILTDFGIQPVYLAAQVVNFVILLLILKKFLYKPILTVLENRKQTVSENIAKAKQIQTTLESTEQQSAEAIKEASKQAKSILDKASNRANKIIADAHEKAQTDIELMIENGKQNISVEREMMKNEMREELAGLVIMGLQTVAGKTFEQQDHDKIVEQAVNNLKEKI